MHVEVQSISGKRLAVSTPLRTPQEISLLQRNFAATCVDVTNNKAYLVGGKASKYLNDVIEISLDGKLAMSVVQVAEGSPMPTPRYGHTYELATLLRVDQDWANLTQIGFLQCCLLQRCLVHVRRLHRRVGAQCGDLEV